MIVEEGPSNKGNEGPAERTGPKPPIDARSRSIISVIFASSGCVAWISAFLWQHDYRQGEQLAAWFNALVNMIILAVMGTVATLLLLMALLLARSNRDQSGSPMAKAGLYLSWIGLAYGAIILLTQLPGPLMMLLN